MNWRQLDPYVEAGFAVWVVTRRRHMPPGHTVADMADDYAKVITEELGGRVDLVVGESTGALIAQYLAAHHPDSVRHVAIVVGADQDSDWAKAWMPGWLPHWLRAKGGAGTVVAEVPACTCGGPIGWSDPPRPPMWPGFDCPPEDSLTEAPAEEAFDSRAAHPRIQAPVLLCAVTVTGASRRT